MKPSFTFRFALSGIWKNRQIYIPYLLTGVVNVSLFYMLATLISNSKLRGIYGGEQVATMLGLGAWQVERLAWKTGLLARFDAVEAAPPVPVPATTCNARK